MKGLSALFQFFNIKLHTAGGYYTWVITITEDFNRGDYSDGHFGFIPDFGGTFGVAGP
jgi:hypothetical protein